MKLKLFFVTIIILSFLEILSGQSFTKFRRIDKVITVNETRLNGELNGAACYYYSGELSAIKFYEKNKPLFNIYIYDQYGSGQLSFVMTDIEKNNLPVPNDSKTYLPGYMFQNKCIVMDFYESGNKQEVGIILYDESPEIDWYDYGEHKKYDDFGTAMHYKVEAENSTIYETRLDGQLNGTQVFLSKSTGFVEKINYYELGILKAQFLFNEDNSINSILYDIETNHLPAKHKYTGKYLEYSPNGTKVQSVKLSFDELPQ